MNSKERHENRYRRRYEKRLRNKQSRVDDIGGIRTAMSYHDLYKCGKKCCSGVRWKQSVQNFERHLFSKTAVNVRKVQDATWKPHKYTHFTLKERGKIRPIDAPLIIDRQVHKAYTQNVLLPLYLPDMIYNNGASLKGKGFAFSRKLLVRDLHSFFRHYGNQGSVIMLDFKQFFPSAPHSAIYERHRRNIINEDLMSIGDRIVSSNHQDKGMPLGVEPSQAEMIALPSTLDNYIKCQLSMRYFGHYMDDYYILVPPHLDTKHILNLVIAKATSIGFTVNTSKTKIQAIAKPFKYCKAKYTLTSSGKVIVNGNRDSVKRARRKIKAFCDKVKNGQTSYEDLWASMNGIFAYFSSYNDHNRILKLRRLFYRKFGFDAEHIENFRRGDKGNEIHCIQQV